MYERVFGGLVSLTGILVLWLVSADPGAVNGPAWVGLAAGAVFVLGGLVVATRGTPLAAWTEAIGTGGILVAFAATGGWVAFGAGPRACSGGIDLPFLSFGGGTGVLECRVAFGYGAVLVVAVLALFLGMGAGRLLPDRRWARSIRKAGESTVIVALSPLFLLVFAWGAVVSVVRAVRARWTRSP